jgi:DNA-binding transcriptional regulator PaaX
VTIWRLVRAGELEPVRIGRRTLYRRSDLDALMHRGLASTKPWPVEPRADPDLDEHDQ